MIYSCFVTLGGGGRIPLEQRWRGSVPRGGWRESIGCVEQSLEVAGQLGGWMRLT